ncbi:diacylglycerol kinase family protein [Aquirufa rosea]|uniref:Diacylglycerol kinase family protein n=1 Tax=Aquirufa rosea TaxID=2509241 RepID=A0A4Q1C317_9BACT|nr:diacylglycerol kinase family protein [Aquirufa rosea]RXK52606.1 diacylglycerol kinase family protein [Aquirufa rosea]
MINFSKAFQSISTAWSGIISLIKEENNAKIHAASTILVIIVGLNIGFMAIEWLWISLAIAGVWVAELFNSALEKITDLVAPEYHPLAKKAKDFAAGAVLVMAIWAAFVFCLISFPHLWMRLVFSN